MSETFKETILLIKADLKRRLVLEQRPINFINAAIITFKPGSLNVLIYRFSRYCYFHGLSFLCKPLALLSQLINTTEISPIAKIGEGFVLADIGAVGIPPNITIGKNCTLMGLNSITLGAMQTEPNPDDRFSLGDHCVLGVYSRIMRPVSLANGTQVKPGSVVISSVTKEGQSVSGVPARRKAVTDYDKIEGWNPLKGERLEWQP